MINVTIKGADISLRVMAGLLETIGFPSEFKLPEDDTDIMYDMRFSINHYSISMQDEVFAKIDWLYVANWWCVTYVTPTRITVIYKGIK